MKSHLLLLVAAAWLASSLASCSADSPSLAEIRTTAEQGYAWAQFDLGVMYDKGEGVMRDEAEAVKWYRKAAEQGLAKAQYNLGVMYDNGKGVPRDEAKAMNWYRRAAEQGNAEAQYNLGKAAEQGDAEAQFILGVMYDKGEGVTRDEAKAMNWYREAAEQGYFLAQYSLGVMYDKGKGVPRDDVEAYMWVSLAVAQGLPAEATLTTEERRMTSDQIAEAQKRAAAWQPVLPTKVKTDLSNRSSYTASVKWYREAAEQGYAWAQYRLGVMYHDGEGVTRYYAEAVNWYRKAAEQGLAEAQNNLGVMYYNGEGVPKDHAEAVNWYCKAAEQGYAEAQYNLGTMYFFGIPVYRGPDIGLPSTEDKFGFWRKGLGLLEDVSKRRLRLEEEHEYIDYVEAYKWVSLAAAQGNEELKDIIKGNKEAKAKAKAFLNVIEFRMTPDQIAEAQKRAAEW